MLISGQYQGNSTYPLMRSTQAVRFFVAARFANKSTPEALNRATGVVILGINYQADRAG